ncbi:MAG: DEAD/DEAH box helicase [Myxococcaceae bacterium]|nr:MAG: DEAD/DEAH box helicase [Myxococcaceae bacterium]
MFDEHMREIMADLPELEAFSAVACRRLLSTAYAQVVAARVNAAVDAEPSEQVDRTLSQLRRLADTLESVAVFDPLAGLAVPLPSVAASAFVAAEALALSSQLSARASLAPSVEEDAISHTATYAALEAAILYMVGGYDINAVAVLQPIPVEQPTGAPASEEDVVYFGRLLCARLMDLCRGRIDHVPPAKPPKTDRRAGRTLKEIFGSIRAACYRKVIAAVDRYFRWLAGDDAEGLAEASSQLRALLKTLGGEGPEKLSSFADIYHLVALVLAAIDRTSARALVHQVPPPSTSDPEYDQCFRRYLRDRAVGTSEVRGRPYMWPSALEYTKSCLPGPKENAVVSLPTGSGKSFVAEIAIAQALSGGWVLYLAPTNALVDQIRRDLRHSLKAFKDLDAIAFTGGAEYVDLAEDRLADDTKRVVAVMTPEKCALLLRTSPGSFAGCTLCVFDECHLLRDPHRGITADAVMAQLFQAAPTAKYLLMSAMMSNPDELAEWLNHVVGGTTQVPRVKWRPSRTARGFVVIDLEGSRERSAQALAALKVLPPKRKNEKFTVPLQAIVGLSGPWTMDGPDDYYAFSLPVEAQMQLTRMKNNRVQVSTLSWKNDVGRRLTSRFAMQGIPSINFLLTSKHHPFSQAKQAVLEEPFKSLNLTPPARVEALLGVAEAELGVESMLRRFVRSGVAVHTSAMLAAEQEAAEQLFSGGDVRLMFATGTLAQGLNLPAVAVVISGTSIGDAREEPDPVRAEETILNGFGRAGRPGFANQGIVFLVSDDAVIARRSAGDTIRNVLDEYPVLAKVDAVSRVTSPIEGLLDHFISGAAPEAGALDYELVSVLAGQGEGAESKPSAILRRTLAAYQHRAKLTDDKDALVDGYVSNLKQKFIDDAGVPAWMARAAMNAGVNIRRAIRMWRAVSEIGMPGFESAEAMSVVDWLHYLIKILHRFPPHGIHGYCEGSKRDTPMARMGRMVTEHEQSAPAPWVPSEDWSRAWSEIELATLAYMNGASYLDVGRILFSEPNLAPDSSRGAGDVIPYVLSFVDKTVSYALAIDAGCLLAVVQEMIREVAAEGAAPEALRSLPFCIRNGCHNLDVLSWHRFGVRHRVCAHALAQEFPLPEDVTEGKGRIKWIRQTLQKWLNETDVVDGVLRHARTVLTDE